MTKRSARKTIAVVLRLGPGLVKELDRRVESYNATKGYNISRTQLIHSYIVRGLKRKAGH